MFIPFGSKSGKRLQSLSLQFWPWPLAGLFSCQARVRDGCERFPAARLGLGQEGALNRDSSKHQTQPLPAPSAEQGKTELSQQADVWCRISSLVLFCYFLKMSSGVSPESAGPREPRAALANAMPWEHLLLPSSAGRLPPPCPGLRLS